MAVAWGVSSSDSAPADSPRAFEDWKLRLGRQAHRFLTSVDVDFSHHGAKLTANGENR